MGVGVSLNGFVHGQSEVTLIPLASSAATSVQLAFVARRPTKRPTKPKLVDTGLPSPVLSSRGWRLLRSGLLLRSSHVRLVSPLSALMLVIELL